MTGIAVQRGLGRYARRGVPLMRPPPRDFLQHFDRFPKGRIRVSNSALTTRVLILGMQVSHSTGGGVNERRVEALGRGEMLQRPRHHPLRLLPHALQQANQPLRSRSLKVLSRPAVTG